MRDYYPLLRHSRLLFGISESEIEKLLDCLGASERYFERDSFILRSGEKVHTIGIVLSGSALVVQNDFWGNRNILSALTQGDSFAEAFACAPSAVLNVDIVASEAVTVLILDAGRILTMCPSACPFHSRMIRNLVADLAGKNLHFNEKITHMSQRSTRAKLLSYLSAEALKNTKAEFDIPFSRQQLADYLSVDRSGLSLELCRLRDEGLIEFSRNHFRLKD